MPTYDIGGKNATMGATSRKFTLELKAESALRVIDLGRDVAEVTEDSLTYGSTMNEDRWKQKQVPATSH